MRPWVQIALIIVAAIVVVRALGPRIGLPELLILAVLVATGITLVLRRARHRASA